MSSSGTYIFDPSLAEMVDEAFERIGMAPRRSGVALTGEKHG